jgi:hypothetical protein
VPTRVRPQSDESVAFWRGREELRGERVSGIRDECPEPDSGWGTSDLGHQLKSAGRRCDYLHLTVTWVRFFPQEQHPY